MPFDININLRKFEIDPLFAIYIIVFQRSVMIVIKSEKLSHSLYFDGKAVASTY